ncbi:MAG: polyprenyl diphosphate synthase, partial [Dehalococcoidia bacterium]
GHRAGTQNIRQIIEAFADHGVKFLTLYAFSTENWSRPSDEVDGLWQLLAEVIDREVQEMHKNGVRLVHIGRRDRLASPLQEAIENAIHLTRDNLRITLCIALDYGGRLEIVDALRRMLEGGVKAGDVTEEAIAAHLDTAGIPDPDLVIRTGGEMRLSNFLLWQTAYSEYYATETCWPDFDEEEVRRALTAYAQRRRRFGGLDSSGR